MWLLICEGVAELGRIMLGIPVSQYPPTSNMWQLATTTSGFLLPALHLTYWLFISSFFYGSICCNTTFDIQKGVL